MCPGSGGWSSPKPNKAWKDSELAVQLFDLDTDPTEKNNLAEKKPELVNTLIKALNSGISNGRTTPGPQQKNDTPVPAFNPKLIKQYPQAAR